MERPWLPPLLAAVVLLPMLDAPLLIDERVQRFEALKWIALDPLAPWQLPLGGSGTWRPLTTWAYRLDAAAPPIVAHAAHVVGQAGLAALVHRWLAHRAAPRAALFGACVFALHPAHVATGGWVGGRPDLGMALCAVAALIAADRRQPLLAGALAAGAVLFKETAVALPALALIAGADRRTLRAMAISAWPLFAVGAVRADVAASYLPSGGGLAIAAVWGPIHGLQTLAPLFHPLALPGLLAVLGALAAIAALLWSRVGDVGRPLAFVALALLPVSHVLPNDGGQWYLLLPSVGAAWLWAWLRPNPVLLVALLAVSLNASLQWRTASVRVDRLIAAADGPADAPPPQDPRDWPHLGPSVCCGLPFQLFAPMPEPEP